VRNPITGAGMPDPTFKLSSGRHGIVAGDSW
jgi:hypothetical protein